jgi:hypothetical protein
MNVAVPEVSKAAAEAPSPIDTRRRILDFGFVDCLWFDWLRCQQPGAEARRFDPCPHLPAHQSAEDRHRNGGLSQIWLASILPQHVRVDSPSVKVAVNDESSAALAGAPPPTACVNEYSVAEPSIVL